MNKYIFILLLLFTSLVSCTIGTSGLPSHPNIGLHPNIVSKFENESERILVLPIWKTWPAFTLPGERFFMFGKPLFLTVKDLPELPDRIPRKTSVGIMVIDVFIGRLMYIDGITIISESGKIVSITRPTAKGETEEFRENCFSQKWRDDLILELKESKGEIFFPSRAIKTLINRPFGGRFQITNSSEDKQAIIDFIQNINQFCEDNYTIKIEDPFEGHIGKMDKKSGESCRYSFDCAPGYFCTNHKCEKIQSFDYGPDQ